MRVFEVLIEGYKGEEVINIIHYVTSRKDTLSSVVEHFTEQCEPYGENLKGVREILTIVEQIGEENNHRKISAEIHEKLSYRSHYMVNQPDDMIKLDMRLKKQDFLKLKTLLDLSYIEE